VWVKVCKKHMFRHQGGGRESDLWPSEAMACQDAQPFGGSVSSKVKRVLSVRTSPPRRDRPHLCSDSHKSRHSKRGYKRALWNRIKPYLELLHSVGRGPDGILSVQCTWKMAAAAPTARIAAAPAAATMAPAAAAAPTTVAATTSPKVRKQPRARQQLSLPWRATMKPRLSGSRLRLQGCSR
jgi:hypothetical protein